MQDLFIIEINEKINQYNSRSISLLIKVKTNNFTKFFKKYKEYLDENKYKINNYESLLSVIHKLSENKRNKERLKKEVSLLKIIIEDIKNGFKDNYIEMFPEFKKFYNIIEDGIDDILSDNDFPENFDNDNREFIEWFCHITRRKLEMCERLKYIQDTPLKALVIFDDKGYETHFTKYHINLESYSDILHNLLKKEISEKYIDKYNSLEYYHFEKIKELTEDLSIKNYFKISLDILRDHEEMVVDIKKQILNVQLRYEELSSNIDKIIDKTSFVNLKIINILKSLEVFKFKNKELLKVISFIYQLPVKKFLSIKDDYFSSKKILDFMLESNVEIIEDIHLPVLEQLEPELASNVKNKILFIIKNKFGYETSNKDSSFLIKRNKYSIFDNNQYYSHEMMVYNFLPETSKLAFSKNKYLNTAGYDKVFKEKNHLRIESEVYSSIFQKKIKYYLIIEVNTFMVNPSISSYAA